MKMRQVRAASPGRNDPDREMSESFTSKDLGKDFQPVAKSGSTRFLPHPPGAGIRSDQPIP